MALYHLSVKAISRKAGRSATGAAAYRAGECIEDERTGIIHDYTRKAGVLYTELLLPDGVHTDRAAFWNALEQHHKRRDAILAREIEIALPAELTPEARQHLAIGFARELADRYRVAAERRPPRSPPDQRRRTGAQSRPASRIRSRIRPP